MSELDKITQIYDPTTKTWKTKEQYKWERDPGFIEVIPVEPSVGLQDLSDIEDRIMFGKGG